MAERALSTLLNELDGVSEGGVEGWGVFLLCCTNRPDLIDAALLRPGRLEHLLMVGFPEEEERRQVLEVHTQRFKLEARGAQAGGGGGPPPHRCSSGSRRALSASLARRSQPFAERPRSPRSPAARQSFAGLPCATERQKYEDA